MERERNYTIELVRFMFAINFLMIHVYNVMPRVLGIPTGPLFISGFDGIIPFMAFAGYFLMHAFKKNHATALSRGETAMREAWDYLKERLKNIWPVYAFSVAVGLVSVCMMRGLPFNKWPMYFVNSLLEFMGLQLTGFGFGNFATGPAVEVGIGGFTAANGPLWFMSGIFVCG